MEVFVHCLFRVFTEQQQKEEQDKKKLKDDINEKFIWGKNNVNRNDSGKLLPRRRLLGEPAHGMQERAVTGPDQYLSMVDKMSESEETTRIKNEGKQDRTRGTGRDYDI